MSNQAIERDWIMRCNLYIYIYEHKIKRIK